MVIQTTQWWLNLCMGDKIVLRTGYRAEVLGADMGVINVLREDGVQMFVSPEDVLR